MLKNKIYLLFGTFFAKLDIKHIIGGKGFLQRFNETLAEDFDSEIGDNIDSLLENTVLPATSNEQYVTLAEMGSGNELFYIGQTKRRIQERILRYNEIRGSVRAFRIMFRLLGFNVQLTENFIVSGFDSPYTFDSDIRRFDSSCDPCSTFSINFTRFDSNDNSLLSQQEIDAVNAIISYNTPINAIIDQVTFNDEPLESVDTVQGDYNNDFNNDFNFEVVESLGDFNSDYSSDFLI